MTVTIRHGDCREVLRTLPDQSVHCCVTSPPYFGLRDYGVAGQIGLEPTPDEFVAELVDVFREVRRVLRDDGTLWLNLGDSYTAGPSGRRDQDRNTRNRDGRNPENATDTGAPFYHQRKVPEGLKPKDLIGVPWRAAFALQADGWYLRQDIIWSKPNPMPESVQDRCTKAHEYIFLLSKSQRYFYDAEAIKEESVKGFAGSEFHTGKTADHQLGRASTKPRRASGEVYTGAAYATPQSEPRGPGSNFGQPLQRNKRSVWEVSTQPFSEAHFATFPPDLIEPCIKAGCPKGGVVLDPFGGAGTTGLVADRLGRDAILIELNPEYAAMAERRIRGDAGMFADTVAVTSPVRSTGEA